MKYLENKIKTLEGTIVVLKAEAAVKQACRAPHKQVLPPAASAAPLSLLTSVSPNPHEYAPVSASESVASYQHINYFMIYKQSGEYPGIEVRKLTERRILLNNTMDEMRKFVLKVNPNMKTKAAVVALHVGNQKAAYFLLDLMDGGQFLAQRDHLQEEVEPYKNRAGKSQTDVALWMIFFATKKQAEENKSIYEKCGIGDTRADNTKDAED